MRRTALFAASTAVAIAIPFVIALVELPTASRRGEDCSTVAVNVAGHLSNALGVVRQPDPECVHRNDYSDGGEKTCAGESDRKE